MGCEATVFYRCLADLLATHWGQENSQTIAVACPAFALLRCAIMCIRRSRPSAHHDHPVLGPLDL